MFSDAPREFRNFVFYPDWRRALAALDQIRAEERHLYEIFPHGRPCKPYLDLDGETLPHPCRHRWRRRQTHRGPLHAHLPR